MPSYTLFWMLFSGHSGNQARGPCSWGTSGASGKLHKNAHSIFRHLGGCVRARLSHNLCQCQCVSKTGMAYYLWHTCRRFTITILGYSHRLPDLQFHNMHFTFMLYLPIIRQAIKRHKCSAFVVVRKIHFSTSTAFLFLAAAPAKTSFSIVTGKGQEPH